MDWATRKVLAWLVSNTMEVEFCRAAVKEAMARYSRPGILNAKPGQPFTSPRLTGLLQAASVRVSIDGRGR